MNKTRLENLSDGVFAIVFTILVLDIRVPENLVHPSSAELWKIFYDLQPIFIGYFITFAVLTTFWIGHSFFFSDVVKVVNRQLVLINMLYLAFVSLLPFSAYLLGRYSDTQAAVMIYGINILLAALMTVARFEYALWSKELDTSHNDSRDIAQSRVRTYLVVITTLLGISLSFFSAHAAVFFYAFPIIFNIIPGLLNATERLFGFRLGR